MRANLVHLCRWALGLAATSLVLTVLLLPSQAQAQIKQPGNHVKYSVELEPHLLFAWERNLGWGHDDDGFGPGLRLSIPIIEDGPIKTINNSMAIGFGLDWAHYSDDNCWYWGWDRRDRNWRAECSGDTFFFPVVLQWNFFVHEMISVFGEPGLAIVHTRWSDEYPCGAAGGLCEVDGSDTDLDPIIMFGGARFHFGEFWALTVRVGWPYASVGASFFL